MGDIEHMENVAERSYFARRCTAKWDHIATFYTCSVPGTGTNSRHLWRLRVEAIQIKRIFGHLRTISCLIRPILDRIWTIEVRCYTQPNGLRVGRWLCGSTRAVDHPYSRTRICPHGLLTPT